MIMFRDALHWQSLSPIVDGTSKHLVPHQFNVRRILKKRERGGK